MDLELCTRDRCKDMKDRKKEVVLEPGLSSCTEWILSFVLEMGVRTSPKGSWFHQKSLPEFLDL